LKEEKAPSSQNGTKSANSTVLEKKPDALENKNLTENATLTKKAADVNNLTKDG